MTRDTTAKPTELKADPKSRLVHIALDERTVVRRSPEVEHERAVAIYDLLDMNYFRPLSAADDGEPQFDGPYRLFLSIEDGKRLVFDIRDVEDSPLTSVLLPLTPFRGIVKDYFQICESYYDAIKKLSPNQIETIDMARRGLHNEGSDLLVERLKDKIELNMATARRLFTLICVLHIRA